MHLDKIVEELQKFDNDTLKAIIYAKLKRTKNDAKIEDFKSGVSKWLLELTSIGII